MNYKNHETILIYDDLLKDMAEDHDKKLIHMTRHVTDLRLASASRQVTEAFFKFMERYDVGR